MAPKSTAEIRDELLHWQRCMRPTDYVGVDLVARFLSFILDRLEALEKDLTRVDHGI